jgi:hypothetical protein
MLRAAVPRALSAPWRVYVNRNISIAHLKIAVPVRMSFLVADPYQDLFVDVSAALVTASRRPTASELALSGSLTVFLPARRDQST